MKKVLALLVLAALVFAGVLLGSPYLAANAFGEALASGDRKKLVAIVDMDAVKANFKAQARERQKREGKKNLLESIGDAIANAVTDTAVEVLVTPETFLAAADEGKMKIASSGYKSINRFALTVESDDEVSKGESMTVILERRGVLRWMVVEIELLITESG